MTLSDSGAAEAPADDLRATLSAAFEAAPDTDASAEDTAPSTDDADSPSRDASGRFAPKTQAAEAPEATAAPETTDQPATEAKAEPASPQTIEPPKSWSAADKATWATIPPAARDIIARREEQVARGFQQKAEESRAYEPLINALTPHANRLQSQGRHPAEVISQLLDTQARFEANPAEGVKWLAQAYGVDLSKLAAPPSQGAGAGEWVDPQIAAIDQRLSQYERHVQTLAQQQEQERAAMAQDAAAREVASVEQDTAKFPHFQAVREEMSRLVLAGVTTDLADAYERAVWTNPAIRERIQQDTLKAQRDAETKAASAARNRGVSVRNNPSSASLAPASAESLRDELLRNWG